MGWNPAIGIPLIIGGLMVLALIYAFGQPKRPGQGRRALFQRGNDERIEPTMSDAGDRAGGESDAELHQEIARLGSEISANRDNVENDAATPREPAAGARPTQPIERIVTLLVTARSGETIPGSNLIVAAEKAGLEFGDMGIFHRLVATRRHAGPVFSMANMVKPGSFDMRAIEQLHTPGVTLFMTLPGPLSALDAWDAMLPTAQRLAELLGAAVLDEERNALGRQRIAHIRDELRAYDRKQERKQIFLR